MNVRDGAPPPVFATAVPALFDALLDVFAPLDVSIAIGDDTLACARIDSVRVFGTEPLWCDEELTRDVFTRCPPTLGTDVVAELYERLAGLAPASFEVTAAGACKLIAHGGDAPAWYGRWRGDGLQALVTIVIHWTKRRGVELRCPLDGYPFAPVRPRTSRLSPGDRAVAAENRALWLPAVCNIRQALGFDREEIEWTTDDPNLRKDWLPRLRES